MVQHQLKKIEKHVKEDPHLQGVNHEKNKNMGQILAIKRWFLLHP